MDRSTDPCCPACGCNDCEQTGSTPYRLLQQRRVVAAGVRLQLVCRHCGKRFTASQTDDFPGKAPTS